MQSNMSHDFSKVPSVSIPRSSFERNSTYKATFDAGLLIPFFTDDVLPGDTTTLNTAGFARMATPFFPLMDNMYMDTHFFFVPLRLLWDNSKKFFGEQDNPADSIDFAFPVLSDFIAGEETLSDYLGLPPTNTISGINALRHRAYNLIYKEWFRDQNLQDSPVINTGDGPDNIADYTLKRRGKRHDYFTSCLPFPQKGEAVNLPLGTSAPLTITGNGFPTFNGGTMVGANLNTSSGGLTTTNWGVADATGPSAVVWNNPALTGTADLTSATASTVNDLREAFQVQRLLERDMRGGTRYSELVRNHFGVNFYDVSYRPEFLGGGSTVIQNTQVASTGTDANTGNLSAFSTVQFKGHGFTKSFVEHGLIMGFVSVRADLTYQQGIPKEFLKSTRYDVFWPTLAHLGEQVVENREIFHTNTANDLLAFGYQERYAEYRYKNSLICGKFRSASPTSLDAWHLSQEFLTPPTLGDTFIQENPPLDRVVKVPSEPHFIFDSFTKMRSARAMPVYGVPGMIDHF